MIVAHQASHERDIRETVELLISRRCFDCVELMRLEMALTALGTINKYHTRGSHLIHVERKTWRVDVEGKRVVRVYFQRGYRKWSREL